jgi:hypothetical protein
VQYAGAGRHPEGQDPAELSVQTFLFVARKTRNPFQHVGLQARHVIAAAFYRLSE